MGEWDTSGSDVFPDAGSGVWSVDSSRSFVDQSNVHNSISVSSSAHAACTIPAVLYWLLRSAAAPCFVNIEISLRMTKPEQLGGGGQRGAAVNHREYIRSHRTSAHPAAAAGAVVETP